MDIVGSVFIMGKKYNIGNKQAERLRWRARGLIKFLNGKPLSV